MTTPAASTTASDPRGGGSDLVTIDAIRAAAALLDGIAVRTPLLAFGRLNGLSCFGTVTTALEAQYQSEYRGVVQYYLLAHNVRWFSKLSAMCNRRAS